MKTHPMTAMRGPIDVHVHLSGNGKGGMDCWHRRRWIMRPFLRAGARDIGLECGFGDRRFDELYLSKLLRWVSGSTLEAAVLLACDWVRDDQGAVRMDLSDLFVSNDEVFAAVKRSPKLLAGISIHPAEGGNFALHLWIRLIDRTGIATEINTLGAVCTAGPGSRSLYRPRRLED